MKLETSHNLKTKLKQIGRDGLWTLLLSNLLMFSTIGLSLFLVFLYVILLAVKTKNHTRHRAILVLGQRLQNNTPGPGYISRLERAKALLESGMIQHVYIVGGITGQSTISESECGKSYILDKQNHSPVFTLHTEDKSQHTLENFKNVRAMISESQVNAVGIITSRFHLARASLLADGFGILHDLCAAETRFVNSAKQWLLMMREAYFIHWYLTGKYWSILTNNQTSLERIQ